MKKEMLEKLYNAQNNLIVVGNVATGKTNGVLFPLVDKIIENKENFMVLDVKEEYINKYHKILKDKDYNVVVLNLRDLDKSDGWNPIQLAYEQYKNGDTDKAIEYLEKMAKTMFYEGPSVDPFWCLTSSDFFVGVVLALFEDAKEDEINLNSVNMIFNGINDKFGSSDYLTHYFKSKNPSSIPYVCAATTILAPKDTKASILSVARQKLRTYVTREKLNLLMNKTTFSFDDIAMKPTAIFFIAKDESKYLNSLAAIFIEQLFTVLFDMKQKNKFNFVLDNFDIIEKVNEFTDMMGSGLSRQIKFLISTRSLEDLSNKYGNYILKLSNQICVTNNLMKVIINDEEETIENKYEEVEIIENEVEYPRLNQTSIKIFDLKEFVHKLKKDSIESKISSIGSSKENNIDFNIDELIKKIDDRIEELEEMERMENEKKDDTKIKSELLQFKIDDDNKKEGV